MDKEIQEYYNWVRLLKKLTKKEMIDLFDDKTSKQEFIRSYLYHVFIHACNIYSYFSKKIDINYSLMDYIQDSNLLLVELVYKDKYEDYNVFCLFLYRKMCHLFEKKVLSYRKSLHISDILKLEMICDNFFKKNGREITLDELQKITNMRRDILMNFLYGETLDIDEIDDEALAVYMGYEEFENNSIENLMPCNSNVVARKCMECLNDRNREIIERIFGLNGNEPKSQSQIAREMGCTRQEISASKERSFRKILNEISPLLDEYRKNR